MFSSMEADYGQSCIDDEMFEIFNAELRHQRIVLSIGIAVSNKEIVSSIADSLVAVGMPYGFPAISTLARDVIESEVHSDPSQIWVHAIELLEEVKRTIH